MTQNQSKRTTSGKVHAQNSVGTKKITKKIKKDEKDEKNEKREDKKEN